MPGDGKGPKALRSAGNQHNIHDPFLVLIKSGLLEELIDQFCDLLRRVLVAVVANAL